MCKVIIDTNSAENFIWDACAKANIAVERKRLDVGDVVLQSDCGTFVLERKTWCDLTASICDGRWSEQKSRMLHDNTTKYGYIIEGNLLSWEKDTLTRMNPSALWGALLKTQIRDGMHVFHTDSKLGTSHLILYLHKQLKAGGFELKSNHVISGIGSKRKRDNLNDNYTILIAMLSVIPGMSKARAEAVVSCYPSAISLSKCSIEDLSKIQCGSRKLGQSLASVICRVFCGNLHESEDS